MWYKNKQSEELNIAYSTSFFARGFRVVGNIDANSDVRIEGIVEGNITTTKKVVIGATGSVIGNIDATSISLMGEISGELNISGLALIGETAKIMGTIKADQLQIDPGAIIEADIKRYKALTHGPALSKAFMNEIQQEESLSKNYLMAKAQ